MSAAEIQVAFSNVKYKLQNLQKMIWAKKQIDALRMTQLDLGKG